MAVEERMLIVLVSSAHNGYQLTSILGRSSQHPNNGARRLKQERKIA